MTTTKITENILNNLRQLNELRSCGAFYSQSDPEMQVSLA